MTNNKKTFNQQLHLWLVEGCLGDSENMQFYTDGNFIFTYAEGHIRAVTAPPNLDKRGFVNFDLQKDQFVYRNPDHTKHEKPFPLDRVLSAITGFQVNHEHLSTFECADIVSACRPFEQINLYVDHDAGTGVLCLTNADDDVAGTQGYVLLAQSESDVEVDQLFAVTNYAGVSRRAELLRQVSDLLSIDDLEAIVQAQGLPEHS